MNDMNQGSVSSDGRWVWDGSQWVPRSASPQTTSPDGLWVWDGASWQPAAAGRKQLPMKRVLALTAGICGVVALLVLIGSALPGTDSGTTAGGVSPPPAASETAPGTDRGTPAATSPARSATPRAPVKGPPAVRVTGTQLWAALVALPVKGRAAKTGYKRDQFGQSWADVDRNGCDTRSDILIATLTGQDMSGRCKVLSGSLNDPYTCQFIAYVRGGASEVDIDHMVALSNAWQTGAAAFPFAKRVALANDPLNLMAVDASTNRQKSDGDAATWLPPNRAFRCAYVARQVAVKTKYRLWVTAPELAAMKRVVSTCPDQQLPGPGPQPTEASNTGGAPEPAGAPDAPVPLAPPPGDGQVAGVTRYARCADAEAAGVTPIRAGTPLYDANSHLDRDRDGVACES